MKQLVALDIETSGKLFDKDSRILCCGVWGEGGGCVFNFDNEQDVAELQEMLADPNTDQIFHNCMYDTAWLYVKYGMKINGVIHDTMTRASLIDEYQPLNLDDCCKRLGVTGKNKAETIEAWFEDWQSKMKGCAKGLKKGMLLDNNEVFNPDDGETYRLSDAELEALISGTYKKSVWDNSLMLWRESQEFRENMQRYNLQDCLATYQLFHAQEPYMKDLQKVYDLECRLIPILLQMKNTGIRFDEKRAAELADRVYEARAGIEQKLIDMYGLTGEMINSPKQLGARMNEMGIHSPVRTKTGNESWGADAINRIHHPVVPMIEEFKNYDAILHKYLEGSLTEHVVNGRIHCTFLPMLREEGGTVTGRFSCLATGTQVFTVEKGYIPIETVVPGLHTITHTGKITEITKLFDNGIRDVYLYGHLVCTDDHLIWTGKEFKEAKYVSFKDIPKECGTLQTDSRGVYERVKAEYNGTRGEVWDYLSQYSWCTKAESFTTTETSGARSACEQGSERCLKCHERKEGRATSQLQRCDLGWTRQPDDKAQWALCDVLQKGDGGCNRHRCRRLTGELVCSSHRRRQDKQRAGQFDPLYEDGTRQDAQKISGETEGLYLGNARVWDIEVADDDHSFLANGYFVHNCREPNLQQIPARDKGRGQDFSQDMRSLFLPEEGQMLAAMDYSQIEYLLLAHFAVGPQAEWFREQANAGVDFHKVAMQATGITYRPVVKTFNYGVIYGMGWKTAMIKNYNLFEKLAAEHGQDIETFTRTIYNDYHAKLPVIKATMEWCQNTAKAQGYIDTMGGRRLHKPKAAYDPETCRINDFIYKMLNKLIQGTAADILKQAIVTAWDAGIYDILTLHLLVHDEQVNSVPFTKAGIEAAVELQQIMGNVYRDRLLVPMKAECELGPNWGYWSGDIFEEMKQGNFDLALFDRDYRETH